jgi:O-antigen/teichoic acid export membrane protein
VTIVAQRHSSAPPLLASGPSRLTAASLIRGSLLLALGNFLSKLTGLATVMVAARVLSPDMFGRYAFMLAFAAFLVFVADLGIDVVATRELAAGNHPDGEILGAAVVLKAALVTVVLIAGDLALLLFSPGLRLPPLLASATVLAAIPGTLSLALSARVRALPVAIWQVVASTLTLVGSVVVLLQGGGLLLLAGVNIAGTAVGITALFVVARRRFPYRLRVNPVVVRRMARQTAPLAVILGGVVVAHRIDVLLLAKLSDPQEVGRYTAAVRLLDGLNLIATAVAAVALPAFTTAEDVVDQLQKGLRYLVAVLLPVAALTIAASGPLLGLIYGARFSSSATTLTILVAAHLFACTQLMWQQALIARHQIRALATLSIAAAVVNVGLNLVLIPQHGGRGAAWASLFSYAVPFVFAGLVPELRAMARATVLALGRPAVATVLALVAARAVPHVIVIFPVAMVAGLLVTRSVRLADIRLLRRALLRSEGGSR